MQKRLDILLVERGLCATREQAQTRILSGEVWSGERRLDKAGNKHDADIPLEVRSRAQPFASRAGQKLHHAIETFGLEVAGRTCLDVGASTGGFTDCLLKRGAQHVFAVDVGYGQIDDKLRQDERVSVLEKTNARYLTPETLLAKNALASEISFLVMDISFISLRKVVFPLAEGFRDLRDWVLLFKPQFEVGAKFIGKGGLVRSEEAVQAALSDFNDDMAKLGFILRHGPERSPVTGKKSGNQEYLIHYEWPKR